MPIQLLKCAAPQIGVAKTQVIGCRYFPTYTLGAMYACQIYEVQCTPMPIAPSFGLENCASAASMNLKPLMDAALS